MADKSFIEMRLDPDNVKEELAQIIPYYQTLKFFHENPDASITETAKVAASETPILASILSGEPVDAAKEALLLATPTKQRITKGKSKGRYVIDEETTKEINNKLKNADWATAHGLELEEPYRASRGQSYNGSALDLDYVDKQLLQMLLTEDEINRIIMSNEFKSGFKQWNTSKSKSNPKARESKVNTDEDLIYEYAGEQGKLPYIDEPWEYTVEDLSRLNDKNTKGYKEFMARKKLKDIDKDFK